jgi:antirestriction protein ArdC
MAMPNTPTPPQPRSELLERLVAGITELTTSERWLRYLQFQGRFHRYSTNNVLLIAAQCPNATRVAGFSAWRTFGRTVRRGEKAIWILAPLVRHRREDEAGDRSPVTGFKLVAVFDVAQTDGPDLPSVCERVVVGDPGQHFAALVAVAEQHGFSVHDHEFQGATNGDCDHRRRRIRVARHNAEGMRVKTLAHELAHALLHVEAPDRRLAELEAESTAYVVCAALGIESGGYSVGYVTTWAGGGEEAVTKIRACCERVQATAASILAEACSLPPIPDD